MAGMFVGRRQPLLGLGLLVFKFVRNGAKKPQSQLTVFQRSPNLCLPMAQAKPEAEDQNKAKATYSDFFAHRLTTYRTLAWDFIPRNTIQD
jgi:hypothetical protein